MKEILEQYLKNLTETSKRGDAREESYYKHFDELIKQYAENQKIKQVDVTILPKKTEAGNLDFRVWDGRNHITGYIEAKDPSITNLDYIEGTEQLKRYLTTFPNVILTNFYEFRLYRDGQRIAQAMIGRPAIAQRLKTAPPVENIDKFKELFALFFSFSLPKVQNARSLAIELAKRTRFLRDEVIAVEMAENESKGHKQITGFYEAFKIYLITTLTEKQFADLYAQTITYGLFAARTRANGEFNRKLAFDFIPHTIGILRDVFRFISLEEPPKSLQIIVDDIAEILNITDVNKILHEYYRTGKGRDPIIHFYETFLATYDPEIRERRGVYYTPEPVVGYITRSIHSILKSHFNLADGLASEEVKLLDPAGGTLTFPAEAIRLAADEFKGKYGTGGLHRWIKKHILADFHAFELMMAPYAIGHLKIGFLFDELDYKMADDERFKLYLTNTLEMEEIEQIAIPGISSLSEESYLAGKLKKEQPILAILGNPPYSVSSINKSDFIEKEMDVYKEDVRNERNIQPLSDDYIKFIRFAHWKIDQKGKGIIGMITNNSYLSGLIHRGMRQSLMKTFDEIYILNLHGNSRIGEKCPDGSKDENVFDIQQGVSISLFIKNKKRKGIPNVLYQDVYGLREKKYEYLNKHYIVSTKWKKLQPSEPYYFFIEKHFSEQARYETFCSIRDVFIQSSSGVKTHRDHFVVGFKKEEVKQRLRTFVSDLPDEMVRQALDLKDTRDWKLKTARDSIKRIDWEKYIRPYAYRPFDIRYICYLPNLIDRGCDRWDLMKNFFYENIGLATTRKIPDIFGITAFICNNVADIHLIGDQNYFFPLYLYHKKDNPKEESITSIMMLFEPQVDYGIRKSNLSHVLVEKFSKEYKKKLSPEEIFCYIYAVLYCETYRIKYAEFLKIDFPRVPFTANYELFKKMAGLGKQLADLHLLKSPLLDSPVAKYQGSGSNDRIEKVAYNGDEQRIYVNKEKYFEGITPEVWNYHIGGYQVLQKYLKDRKGRNIDDAPRYCRIVTALSKTIEIQKQIDEIYPEVEKEPVQFK